MEQMENVCIQSVWDNGEIGPRRLPSASKDSHNRIEPMGEWGISCSAEVRSFSQIARRMFLAATVSMQYHDSCLRVYGCVSGCVCVRACVCVSTCVCVCVCLSMSICLCVCVCVCACVHVCAHVCVRETSESMRVCVLCLCVRMCVSVYVHAPVCAIVEV